MSNWIKTHKLILMGICCVLYIIATGIPVAISYGWVFDIRPFIIATDVVAALAAMVCFINATIGPA